MESGRPKILVVDDQVRNLVAMSRLLAPVEAEILTAASGLEALALCQEHAFALLLLDVRMPDMDGYEVAEHLSGTEESRLTPILFITGAMLEDAHRLRGYRAGAVDYLQKPVDEVILLSKVGVFLELHRQRERLEAEVARRTLVETELHRHRHRLQQLVEERTRDLAASERRLRQLAGHIETIRERERRWIAQELHDELGSDLANLKMSLIWLQRKLPDLSPGLADRFEDLQANLEETIRRARAITLRLRPPALDNLGLASALEELVAEFNKGGGPTATFETDLGGVALEEELKTALFRIVQESLTNVSRHARASRVRVHLQRIDDQVCLIVGDDGVGLPAELASRTSGAMGLQGMRERVRHLGGEISITSAPGEGTRVVVQAPLSRDREEAIPREEAGSPLSSAVDSRPEG
ncbi:MAG: response regulator [Magnetococcales bacterium]|nr:response regulator [Magnetococcales bacterium]MBF0156877.1 response regulator [Magnetococcales bacterium]